MTLENYKSYTLEDYLEDDNFAKWVYNPTPELESFFQELQDSMPVQRKNILHAREILKSIQQYYDKNKSIDIDVQDLYDEFGKKVEIQKADTRKRYIYYSTSIAASFLALVAVLALFFTQKTTNTGEVFVQTDFGMTEEVSLPDGSIITLNSNSTLSYKEPWNQDKAREVWLQGEAFFDIRENPEDMHPKFLVHTNELDVEVLGTTFNINARDNSTDVLLTSGKVKVQNNYDQADQSILQNRGDMVSINQSQKQLVKTVSNVQPVISWKDNLLIFERTPITEIFSLLEENYGYTVQIGDSAVLKQDFVGAYPADDIEVLLKSLERIIELEREGKTLIIK